MGARILVAEDNQASLALMTYLLRAYGHEVSVAGDGEEALRAVAGTVPDMILMDIHMPKMDGFETVRLMRRDTRLARIPIIAVTAYAMVGDRERVLAGGFDGYLPKPIVPQTFADDINYFLARRVGGAAAPRATGAVIGYAVIVGADSPRRAVVAGRLSAFGCGVLVCTTAAEAVAACATAPADVVIVLPAAGHSCSVIGVSHGEECLRILPFALQSPPGAGDAVPALAIGQARFISAGAGAGELAAALDAALKESGA